MRILVVAVALVLVLTAPAVADEPFGRLPLSFEDHGGAFIARGAGYGIALGARESVLSVDGARVRMRLVGARTVPGVGERRRAGAIRRYSGNTGSLASAYARVRYSGVWPGVDVVYHGRQQRFEYDFVVASGADPHTIRLRFGGARRVSLNARGELVVHTAAGRVVQPRPVLYQGRDRVRGGYVVRRGEVTFRVGAYDRSRPLTIDPVVDFATYVGGDGYDSAYEVALDSAGNVYVAGTTPSLEFPTKNAAQPNCGCGFQSGMVAPDAFISKFTPDGSALVYSTFLGATKGGTAGLGFDFAYGLDVTPAGVAWVTGATEGSDFPVVGSNTTAGGYVDGFVARLSADGALEFSRLFGGNSQDEGRGIDVDADGNVYVTGDAGSTGLATPGAYMTSPPGGFDGFVMKLTPAGAVSWFSYFGGSDMDFAYDVAAHDGQPVVIGDTESADLPTRNAVDATYGGLSDAFVAKLSANGTSLVHSTYLGGAKREEAQGIDIDAAGRIYVAGSTYSSDFPSTPGAFQGARNAQNHPNFSDAFVAQLGATGGLNYSTYLGGGGFDTRPMTSRPTPPARLG